MHLHPDMLPQKATCLGNQVMCMIAEYHLTASVRGHSSLPPIIPQEVAPLLPKELCARRCVRRHQRCEGRRPCHGPPGSHLAASARYGQGRQGDGLRDFGGLSTSPRPAPGVISDSEDEQPHFPGGC